MTIHPDRTPPASGRFHPGTDGAISRRPLPRETIRHVLDSDRRREVVRCVLAADDPIAVRTLVGRLADAEQDPTVATTIHQLRQRIHTTLCETHLPLLEKHDIVRYDRDRNLVAPAANCAAFDSRLEFDSLDRPIASRLE
ncbi:DUF7344 domain-containing protein [Natrinema altunense]|uniref:DUF7344 domain-containing protein n=1 Tax=Natrinema altunense (strain JCM 12890 / CGMCC 1.3731 / AJ2) TaxID=1227494 RepID=L9ZGR3_NATA2|nr:hypothetical protein [Natrinema altunense]ELY85251.1 hypothetical protein C485_13300 [Natrinema altunense JCM 12890]